MIRADQDPENQDPENQDPDDRNPWDPDPWDPEGQDSYPDSAEVDPGSGDLSWEERERLQLAKEAQDAAQAGGIDVLRDALPYQLALILDPSLRKAVCCERRSGKSYTLALALVDMCVRRPGAKCVYLALTQASCRGTMWGEVIEPILLRHGIAAVITSLDVIKFANGSAIYLRGVDATPKQKHMLRGQAFDLAVVDECQDFTQDLRALIRAVLGMALAQRAAPLILAGTPGNSQGLHYWWLINRPDSTENGWKRYRFYWRDNTKVDLASGLRVCDSIAAFVQAELESNPALVMTPEYRQEYCGEWVIETSARIYRYEPTVNDIQAPPPPAFFDGAHYVLGFDLGWKDPSALVIIAWNLKHSPQLYVILSEEHPELLTQKLAARIKALDAQYHFDAIVGDSANLNVVNDMQTTYQTPPLLKAHKLGKEAHMQMLNSDFQTGAVRVLASHCETLSYQLQTCIWDRKALLMGKRVEDPRYHNHSSDALLYAHHFSHHHWFRPDRPSNPFPDHDQQRQTLEKQLIKRNRTQRTEALYSRGR